RQHAPPPPGGGRVRRGRGQGPARRGFTGRAPGGCGGRRPPPPATTCGGPTARAASTTCTWPTAPGQRLRSRRRSRARRTPSATPAGTIAGHVARHTELMLIRPAETDEVGELVRAYDWLFAPPGSAP